MEIQHWQQSHFTALNRYEVLTDSNHSEKTETSNELQDDYNSVEKANPTKIKRWKETIFW